MQWPPITSACEQQPREICSRTINNIALSPTFGRFYEIRAEAHLYKILYPRVCVSTKYHTTQQNNTDKSNTELLHRENNTIILHHSSKLCKSTKLLLTANEVSMPLGFVFVPLIDTILSKQTEMVERQMSASVPYLLNKSVELLTNFGIQWQVWQWTSKFIAWRARMPYLMKYIVRTLHGTKIMWLSIQPIL